MGTDRKKSFKSQARRPTKYHSWKRQQPGSGNPMEAPVMKGISSRRRCSSRRRMGREVTVVFSRMLRDSDVTHVCWNRRGEGELLAEEEERARYQRLEEKESGDYEPSVPIAASIAGAPELEQRERKLETAMFFICADHAFSMRREKSSGRSRTKNTIFFNRIHS
jgi:hypothetical protein